MQRQLDLTTAVCQERLLAAHVRHSLAMVELVSDSLAFDDALDIYVRIMRLNAEQARNVGSRALAELGRRHGLPTIEELDTDSMAAPDAEEEGADVSPDPDGRSGAVMSRLRRRLQGRVHADLRERINLAAARAEDDLFKTHVDNALLFAKALAEELPAPAGVDRYLETMLLPEGMGDVVYNRALRIVADRVLPPMPGTRPAGQGNVAGAAEAR